MAQSEVRNENEIWIIEPEGEWLFGYTDAPTTPTPEEQLQELKQMSLAIMEALVALDAKVGG